MLNNASEWKFLDEGRAHIVFSYIGISPLLVFKGEKVNLIDKVIRLNKVGVDIEFNHELVSTFGLDEFVDVPEKISLTGNFIKDLLDQALPYRANHRIVLPFIIPTTGHLLPNYHSPASNFSIEIKPKFSGALCLVERSTMTTDMYSNDHYKFCRFCNHNYSKEFVNSKNLRYCPMELFSGESTRVLDALRALQLCPSNNFKVYKSGMAINPSDASDQLIVKTMKISCQTNFIFKLYTSLVDSWSKVAALEVNLKDLEWKRCLDHALALRDCSFIIRIFPDDAFDIKLIDFDKKSSAKLEYHLNDLTETVSKMKELKDQIKGE